MFYKLTFSTGEIMSNYKLRLEFYDISKKEWSYTAMGNSIESLKKLITNKNTEFRIVNISTNKVVFFHQQSSFLN